MTTKTGWCKYCGQAQVMSVPDDWTQEQTDRDATAKCNCAEAVAQAAIEDMISRAESTVDAFFKDKSMDSTYKVLKTAIEPMARRSFKKLTITADGMTVTMKKTDSGIQVSTKEVIVESSQS